MPDKRTNILIFIKPLYTRNTEVFVKEELPKYPDEIYQDCKNEQYWKEINNMPVILSLRENVTKEEAIKWAMDLVTDKAGCPDPKIFTCIDIKNYEIL